MQPLGVVQHWGLGTGSVVLDAVSSVAVWTVGCTKKRNILS